MKFKKKQVKSRKLMRKEQRMQKKAKKHEFFRSKKERGQLAKQGISVKEKQITEKRPKATKQAKSKLSDSKIKLSLQDEIVQEMKQKQREKQKLDNQMKKNRVKQLKEDNEQEDADIRRLEKQLKINKRSEKAVSNFFSSDGLDYLLDVCDRKKLEASVSAEKHFKDEDKDFDDDMAAVTGNTKRKRTNSDSDTPEELPSKKGNNKQLSRKISEVEDNLDKTGSDSDLGLNDDDDESSIASDDSNLLDSDDNESEVDVPKNSKGKEADKLKDKFKNPPEKHSASSVNNQYSDGGDSSFSDGNLTDDNDCSNDEENLGDSGGPNTKVDDGLWEDIYGRTRDKDGNVVNAYKPPHMREGTVEGSDSEKLIRLKKQMKGLLNRLAENNMISIASQIEAIYMANSRNDMNETLWTLLRESLLTETLSPERLVAEHAMLVAVLGANVGAEVAATILQKTVTSWHQQWESKPAVENKETNNVMLLLCYMFHFKIFHCTLLYDILEKLLGKLDEKEAELILLVLRTVGFSLRKEDSIRLKDFVLRVQTMANNTSSASEGTRARFMLDTVLAIKNNNMTKIPNYNPEYADRLKKSLKVCIRKGNYNPELKVSLDDMLKVDERGRWWVVGSAWTGILPGEKEKPEDAKEGKKKSQEGYSNKLLELAKKQRMNTDTRRAVFCSLMSAEDYLDAFEKLMKLGLKGPTEREIMNVLLHCLLVEKSFNMYYAHLARRFCTCDRRFQIMLQFTLWDKIREIESLPSTQVSHLAKFLANVILEKSLPISVLKIVQFAEMDKPAVRFIRQVLLGILMSENEESSLAVFSRIAVSKNLKLFREGLRLFLHHFVLKSSKSMAGDEATLLNKRVRLADSALSAADRSMVF